MASLDRYQVEDVFRQSKSGEFVNLRPIWHWTDSKIRCHILCCIIALSYHHLIRLWLKRAGLQMSIDTAMNRMRRLRSCLCWHAGKKEPVRMIEDPTPEQEQIPAVFGYKNRRWGLTKIEGVGGWFCLLLPEKLAEKGESAAEEYDVSLSDQAIQNLRSWYKQDLNLPVLFKPEKFQ